MIVDLVNSHYLVYLSLVRLLLQLKCLVKEISPGQLAIVSDKRN